jgi:hypothetical protein
MLGRAGLFFDEEDCNEESEECCEASVLLELEEDKELCDI